MIEIKELLKHVYEKKSSDLHLSTGLPPMMRIDGDLERINETILDEKDLLHVFDTIMNDKQKKEFEEKLEIDFSFAIEDLARFRINAFHQARGLAVVFRLIPSFIPTLDSLNMPAVFKEIANANQGLV